MLLSPALDAAEVIGLYKDYVNRIVRVLQDTLAYSATDDPAAQIELPTMVPVADSEVGSSLAHLSLTPGHILDTLPDFRAAPMESRTSRRAGD